MFNIIEIYLPKVHVHVKSTRLIRGILLTSLSSSCPQAALPCNDSIEGHVRAFQDPCRSADSNVDGRQSRPGQLCDDLPVHILLAQDRRLADGCSVIEHCSMRQQSAHSASANVHGKTASVAIMLFLLVTAPPIAFFLYVYDNPVPPCDS